MTRAPRAKNGQFLPGTHWRPAQPFRDADWLRHEYVELERSASEIAMQFGVTDAAIFHWLRKHGIPRRTVSQARKIKYWGVSGPENPMFGKRDEDSPTWNGGITPERQRVYNRHEWLTAEKIVRERDSGICQRCGDTAVNIHHIAPFSVVELRTEPSNLVMLCHDCHVFVHSKRNTDGEYLRRV